MILRWRVEYSYKFQCAVPKIFFFEIITQFIGAATKRFFDKKSMYPAYLLVLYGTKSFL